MTDREKLIEEAAEAFGGITSAEWSDASVWERVEVREGIRRALAVFEKAQGEPSDAQVPTPDEWGAQIRAEQGRAASKGYTAEHDAEHGIRHLLNWAIDYSRQGKAKASSGLILSALDLLDAMTPESGLSFDPDVLSLVSDLRALRAAWGTR